MAVVVGLGSMFLWMIAFTIIMPAAAAMWVGLIAATLTACEYYWYPNGVILPLLKGMGHAMLRGTRLLLEGAVDLVEDLFRGAERELDHDLDHDLDCDEPPPTTRQLREAERYLNVYTEILSIPSTERYAARRAVAVACDFLGDSDPANDRRGRALEYGIKRQGLRRVATGEVTGIHNIKDSLREAWFLGDEARIQSQRARDAGPSCDTSYRPVAVESSVAQNFGHTVGQATHDLKVRARRGGYHLKQFADQISV